MRSGNWLAAVVSGWAVLSAPVFAEDPHERPRWEVNLGGFLSSSTTKLRLDSGTLGVGDTITFEEDLGFDTNHTAFRVDATLRYGKRRQHRIDASYFQLSRDSLFRIDEDLQIGDTIFPLGARLDSNFELDVAKIDYSYMFISNDQTQIGASAGLFVSGIGVSIEADATIAGQTGQFRLAEAEDVTLPLPTLGVRGTHNFTPRLSLSGHADIFFLEFQEYEGSLQDLFLGLEYQVIRNLALGVGYNWVDMDLEYTRSPDSLGASIDFEGALFYLEFSG